MDWIFIGVTAVIALLSLGNWRAALYCSIVLDLARDPIRKLSAGQSSLITIIVGVVWLAALLGALVAEGRECRLMLRRYPTFRWSMISLFLGLLPGAFVSISHYDRGWMLAVIGIASYTAPYIGVTLGYLWPRRVEDVYRWMMVYVVLNSIFLVGVVFEAAEMNMPGLGGMKMTWIRNHGADMIKLICGYYRSPDVMGLHAAHVVIFAALLALRSRFKNGWFWLIICCWAMTCVLLSGRRKMIAIPIVFLVTYLNFVTFSSGRKRVAVSLAVFASVVIGGLQFVIETQDISDEYSRFATSIATEGFERTSGSFERILVDTIDQSGWLGDGLGTVTQGRQYLGVVTNTRDWQEDGLGRLFKELGIIGVLMVLAAGILLLSAVYGSIKAIPPRHPVHQLQFGIYSTVAANFASFVVSHQAYSGDPLAVLTVGFCIGIGLGLPRPVWNAIRQKASARQFEEPMLVEMR